MSETQYFGHYHQLTLEDGTREYIPMVTPDEDRLEAFESYIMGHKDMEDRKRNIERTRNAIRESIVGYHACHPTSWYREEAAKAGLPFPAPVGRKAKRGRSK